MILSDTSAFFSFRPHPPQRLKAALWFAIGKMVDEESLQRNRNATPQFIGALTDMVWHQIGTQAPSISVKTKHKKNIDRLTS